jgi:hypothetical protein
MTKIGNTYYITQETLDNMSSQAFADFCDMLLKTSCNYVIK